jgi:hypothetical protein
MADGTGSHVARGWRLLAAGSLAACAAAACDRAAAQRPAADPPTAALKALVDRVQPEPTPANPAAAPGAAPLPGEAWTDPDSVNWTESPGNAGGRRFGRIGERRGDRSPRGQPMGGRLLDRLRDEMQTRADRRTAGEPAASADAAAPAWPRPERLVRLLEQLRGSTPWAGDTLAAVEAVLATAGPRDPAADAPLIALGDTVPAGMTLADTVTVTARASEIRRAALAVARRVAVWRATAAACAAAAAAKDVGPSRDVALLLADQALDPTLTALLPALERFEVEPAAAEAAAIRDVLATLDATATPAARAVATAVREHYHAPNLRVALHRDFITRLLPKTTVDTGPMQDFVLGRRVRGTRTLEQSLAVRFMPDPDEIRVEILVAGVVASRTVTDSGPVSFHSRGQANFTVRKPVTVSTAGVAFGSAVGTASNDSRLASIQTDFDGVPLMGSLVRSIARNQHDESKADATREVNARIISRACREVDQQAEPRFAGLIARARERAWEPLVALGLEPTPVALETTADVATARLRLAGAEQLAAHTPRPRAPADSLLSVQLHESSLNNACERLDLAGRKLPLEDLVRLVCSRLGLPPELPADLPENVTVTFGAVQPLRVECRDGLVRLRVTLDALECGRRSGFEIVGGVTYRPVGRGPQVFLEREGPVQLSGPGHQGRMELALRTVFGKVFPKERPFAVLPAKVVDEPRLADVRAVQAVSADGWLAFALAAPAEGGPAQPSATAGRPQPRRLMRR